MEQRIPAILLFILSGSIIGWLFHTIPPVSFLSIIGFFLTVCICAYALGFILFISARRSLLFSVFLTGSLFLRFIGLRHILYTVLFAITLLSIEHMATQKQSDSN